MSTKTQATNRQEPHESTSSVGGETRSYKEKHSHKQSKAAGKKKPKRNIFKKAKTRKTTGVMTKHVSIYQAPTPRTREELSILPVPVDMVDLVDLLILDGFSILPMMESLLLDGILLLNNDDETINEVLLALIAMCLWQSPRCF